MRYTVKSSFLLIVFFAAWCSLFFMDNEHQLFYSPHMTLREFARQNDIKPGRLKAEIGRPTARGRALLRDLGLAYREVEDRGYLLPVTEAYVKYV